MNSTNWEWGDPDSEIDCAFDADPPTISWYRHRQQTSEGDRMSWEVLMQELEQLHNEQTLLTKIATIVRQHPEWVEQEPELEQLLKKCGLASAGKDQK